MTKIFCDIADKKIISKFSKKKLDKGITTNPTLMRKAGAKNYKQYATQLIKLSNNKPISLEVFADDYATMKKQALEISTWGKNVFVKIPIVNSKNFFMGKLIKELHEKNIKLNITAVYNFNQVKKSLNLLKITLKLSFQFLQEELLTPVRIQSQNFRRVSIYQKKIKTLRFCGQV